jgi:hypothetical protein
MKNIKLLICSVLTLVLIFYTWDSAQASQLSLSPKTTVIKSPIDNNILNKLKGKWVTDKYISDIVKYKSPAKAEIERENSNDLSYISIKQDKNGYHMDISYGFHNITWGNIVKFQKVQTKFYMVTESESISKPEKGTEKYVSQFEIVFENISDKYNKFSISKYEYIGDTPNGIKRSIIKQSDYKKYTFSKLKDIQQYMNSLIIKGNYTDEKGNKYIFTDSKAIFPNKSFQYRVNYDSFNYRPDFIYDPNSNNTYFYVWKDKYLDLLTSPNGKTDPATFTRVYHLKQMKSKK